MAKSAQHDKNGSFTKVSNQFVMVSNTSHEAFRIYVVLRMHVNAGAETGIAFPSYDRIKELTGIKSFSTIAKALRELEAGGWIERKKRYGNSTIYTLTSPTPRVVVEDDALLHPVEAITTPDVGQSYTPSKTNNNHLTRTINKNHTHAAPKTQPPPPAGADAPCVPSEHNDMDNNHEKFCLPDETKRNRRIIETITRDATETSMILSFLELLPLRLTPKVAKTQLSAAREIIASGATEADMRAVFAKSKPEGWTVVDMHSLKRKCAAMVAERKTKPALIPQDQYTVEYN
jgi:hypothetical protein